jgi:hypothetical protein
LKVSVPDDLAVLVMSPLLIVYLASL